MLVVVTSATGEPVSLTEAKEHLRVETTVDDTYIPYLIETARRIAENKMRRAILPVQYRLILDSFPGTTGIIELPISPLLSATGSTNAASTSVCISYYLDTTVVNDSTTISATVYAVDVNSEPGRIYPIYGNEWPSCVTDEKKDAVQILFYAGYTSTTTIPQPIKQWIKMKVASLYENREPAVETVFTRKLEELPHHYFDGLLDPYMIIDIA